MAHDVFISHSSNNRPVANAVCAALEHAGIRCWIAPRDVMPGRSYSGEITRAIQQSRAFILIFSAHSNNSEQVLREVQLAANSRLHIVQFRIDAVVPSDDLEYYLSGPHWLDAVTPPLENHLDQLTSSMKALLSLPRTEGADSPAAPPPRPPLPPAPMPTARSDIPMAAIPPPASPPVSGNRWKIVALAVASLGALGIVALVIGFTLLQPKPPVTTTAPATAPAPTSPATAPPATPSVLTAEEADVFVKDFNRDMERGDVNATMAYMDETVNYYVFGLRDKAFIADQLRQYLAAVPVRAFVVGEVKVQPGPKPAVATVVFESRYSVRDALGNPASGRTRSEWDVVRRAEGLKIIRTNWITYPDPASPR
jgi:hypothetical protein